MTDHVFIKKYYGPRNTFIWCTVAKINEVDYIYASEDSYREAKYYKESAYTYLHRVKIGQRDGIILSDYLKNFQW